MLRNFPSEGREEKASERAGLVAVLSAITPIIAMFFTQEKIQKYAQAKKPVFIFAILFLLYFFPSSILGQTNSDPNASGGTNQDTEALRDKITQKNNELSNLKEQIDTYQKQLNATQKESKTLQSTVKALDLDRQKMSTSIALTQKQLEATSLSLNEITYEIQDTEETIKASTDAVKELLRTIDQADSRNLIEAVLSDQPLSDVLDETMQLSKFRVQVSDHLKNLKLYKDTLQKQQEKKDKEKKNLANYKVQLTDQKVVLDIAKKEKSTLLAITKDRETSYQKILATNLAKKEAFEKELADYESQLTKRLDQKYIPTAGVKILAWPLEVPFVTQHFGVTKDSKRLYASGAHNGTDLRASVGTKLTASASGVVIGVGDTDVACPKASYGKWVLIKHYNGLTTLMAHFSLIKVSQGQQVAEGDLVGYSGNTGYSTGPHLHVSVFASDGVTVGTLPSKSCSGRIFTMPLPTAQNAYLDPEAYFPNL